MHVVVDDSRQRQGWTLDKNTWSRAKTGEQPQMDNLAAFQDTQCMGTEDDDDDDDDVYRYLDHSIIVCFSYPSRCTTNSLNRSKRHPNAVYMY